MGWRERVNEETRRQAEGEAARKFEGNTPVTHLSPEDIVKQEILEEFDALGVPELLRDINGDIWGGRGVVSECNISPFSRREIVLTAQAPRVFMTKEGIDRRRFGSHKEPVYRGMQQDTLDYTVYETRFGFYQERIGDRVTGYGIREETHFLKVILDLSPNEYLAKPRLVIEESHGLDTAVWCKMFGEPDDKYSHRPSNDSSILSFFRGRFTRLNTDRGGVLFFDHNKAVLSFSFNSFGPDLKSLMKDFVDVGLLASSVARTPDPIENAQKEAEAEIARITSLIGKFESV